MRILYFGTGDFGIPSLEALAAGAHEIAGVVTGPDKPQGRFLKPRPTPIREKALALGVPVLDPVNVNDPDTVERLRALDADVFVVIAYGVLLSGQLLGAAKRTCLNVHGSLLPAYRGAAPIQRAILAGETRTGVSVIRMTPRLDAGDVLIQKETPIGADEDVFDLEARLARLGAEALLESLEAVASGATRPVPQDESRVSLAPKIAKKDAQLDWTRPARELHDRVRALKRWPKTRFSRNGKNYLVLRARCAQGRGKPGELLSANPAGGLVIAAGEGALEILEIQEEGKRPLVAEEFLKGARWVI